MLASGFPSYQASVPALNSVDSLRRARMAAMCAGISFLALFLFIFHEESIEWSVRIAEWAQSTGPLGMAVFALMDALVVSTLLPGVVFTVMAGAIWGILYGGIVAVSGKWLGAQLAFLIGRYLCMSCASWIRDFSVVQNGIEMIGYGGWKVSLLLRLSPVVPYNILNFVFAFTNISFLTYAWTSLLGMIPGTLFLVYLGHIAGTITKSVHAEEEITPARLIFLLVGVIISAICITLVHFEIRKQMKKLVNVNELPS